MPPAQTDATYYSLFPLGESTMRRGTEQRQNRPKGWVISGAEYSRRTPGNEERSQSLTNEEVPFSLPAVPQTVYERMVDLSL